MKIKHQLSIATLVMAGVFATGCSQQSVMGEGASQVAGGQQVSGGQQVAGGEQMAGGQQVAGGQQAAGGQQVAGGQQAAGGQQVAGGQQGMDSQIPATVPVAEVPMAQPKPPVVVAPKPMPKPVNKWCHSHAANSMTKSVSHCHKYNQRNHSHSYGQKKAAPVRTVTKYVTKVVPKIVYKDRVVYKPVYKTVPAKPATNKWCHSHPANSMTKSVSHCHKYTNRNHSHSYGQKVAPTRPYVAPKVPTMAPKAPPVDVFALQTKLKAKGYYRGPIDGVVGSGTRAALQQFMQNQR